MYEQCLFVWFVPNVTKSLNSQIGDAETSLQELCLVPAALWEVLLLHHNQIVLMKLSELCFMTGREQSLSLRQRDSLSLRFLS